MSKRMEKLRRIATPTLLLVFAFVVSVAQPAMGQLSTTEEMPFALLIEPIEGLTTARHKAPRVTALPVGTTLNVCHPLPEVKLRDIPFVRIRWEGAEQVRRTETMSWAECHLNDIGEYSVRAIVDGPNNGHWEHEMVIRVVDFPVEAIHVRNVTVSVETFDLDESATNQETMEYYFNKNGFGDSIATLQQVGRDSKRLRANKLRGKAAASTSRFRTSINRPMIFEIDVTPPEFGPLIEWREGGQASRLCAWGQQTLDAVGVHTFSFGPPDRARTIEIESYEVQFITHQGGRDIVPEGQLVTFEAVTNPAGYEDDITWLSSTKYGTGTPVIGYGPTFTVQFDDTWGPYAGGGMFQWLGIKADNAVLNQDQKTGGCCQTDGSCTEDTEAECQEMGGEHQGAGTSCGCDGQQEVAHAGAIDNKPFDGEEPQTPAPSFPQRDDDTTCDCKCNDVEGPTTVDAICPPNTSDYDNYTAKKYTTTITCVGGAILEEVVWDKTSGKGSTEGGSARYRWCDDNGNNRIVGRSDFRCNRDGNASAVKVPMCSPGKFTICATPIFKCENKRISGKPCCIEVTAS